MNIKEQLEQFISSEADKIRNERYQFEDQITKMRGYLKGANDMKELLLIACNALEVAAKRKECNSYECCASCGPIYECEEALTEIQKKITQNKTTTQNLCVTSQRLRGSE